MGCHEASGFRLPITVWPSEEPYAAPRTVLKWCNLMAGAEGHMASPRSREVLRQLKMHPGDIDVFGE